MKKIMLTAAAVATLASSTALASMEDVFYVKVNGGWEKLNKIKRAKSENSYFGGLGVGYYVMDNVRADLTFDHYFDPKHKFTGTDEESGFKYTSTVKGQIDTLMLNGYVDLFDVSVAKVFVGAGVGMSQVSAKSTFVDTDPTAISPFYDKAKKKNNFSYALHAGASTEFAPGVNGELFYSYRDFGKTKKFKEAEITAAYKGHHVGVGIRFDM